MSTFTSSSAFKVGSTKKLALGLLGYYRSIEEALNCIKDNISDSGSWAVDLDDAASGTYNYYDLINDAATATNSVVTSANAYVGQTTTTNEASLRSTLSTNIDSFNTAFNNVLELFSDGITTGGQPTWGGTQNTVVWVDASTNTGLLMNMSYEDQLIHQQNMKILADAFSVSLTSVTVNLGNVDRTASTILSTLHITNYDDFIAAAYTLNCKLVSTIDDLQIMISNQKINGELMTTTASANYLIASQAVQSQWTTTDGKLDSIFSTLSS